MPVVVSGRQSIAYLAQGQGAPVLFIQGVGVPASGWRPQLEGLSSCFHCASIDNRGMGASSEALGELRIADMAADALAVMNHLGWTSAHVVGHSVGGLVAQELALAVRDRVRSLTLMCTFLRGAEAARISPFIVWTGLRTYVGSRRMRRHAFLEIVLSPRERAGDLDAEAAHLAQLFGRDVADASPMAMRQLRAASRYDASRRLCMLDGLPTLVLSGASDRLALPKYGRALAAAIPGARYLAVEGAHGLPITSAAHVNDLLSTHFTAADRQSAAHVA